MTNRFCRKLSFTFFICSNFLTALILLYPQANVWAETVNEEVFISADHMRLSVNSGESTYTGNVKISQGKLILSGDEITVRQKDNVIQSIIILGKPARYNNTTAEGETIVAESEKMTYDINQNKLVLTINAILEQPDHRVSSQKIIYDTKKRIIIAGDKGQSEKSLPNNTRVNITLTPKK